MKQLIEALKESAKECKESAAMNGDPYADIFHVMGIVLGQLAGKLENGEKSEESLLMELYESSLHLRLLLINRDPLVQRTKEWERHTKAMVLAEGEWQKLNPPKK